jgi:hypothetical protein
MQQHAPVTECSGNRCWVHWRWGCPKFLRQSFEEYANGSIQHSLWARAFYASQQQAGKIHQAIIRALAFNPERFRVKWQRIMWRSQQDCTPHTKSIT